MKANKSKNEFVERRLFI